MSELSFEFEVYTIDFIFPLLNVLFINLINMLCVGLRTISHLSVTMIIILRVPPFLVSVDVKIKFAPTICIVDLKITLVTF
jgi:hypothetical protein